MARGQRKGKGIFGINITIDTDVEELNVDLGDFNLTFAELEIPQELQDAVDALSEATLALGTAVEGLNLDDNLAEPIRNVADAFKPLESVLDSTNFAASRLVDIFDNVRTLTPEKIEALGKGFESLGRAFGNIDAEKVAEGVKASEAFAAIVENFGRLAFDLALFDTEKLDDLATSFGRLREALGDLCPALEKLEECLPEPGKEFGPSPTGFPPHTGFPPPAPVFVPIGGGMASAFAAPADDLGAFLVGLDQGREGVDELGVALRGLEGVGEDVFRRLETVLRRFTATGKFEWRELLRTALEVIAGILEAQTQAAGFSSSTGGGGVFDILGRALGGIFGGIGGGGASGGATLVPLPPTAFPFVAEHGGTVATNQPVLVGEAGPEIFVPPAPGEIIPNDRLGGFGGGEIVTHFHYNIDARGAEPGVEQRIQAMMRRESRQWKDQVKYEIFNDARRGGVFSRLSHR